jgi:hypothetical protein
VTSVCVNGKMDFASHMCRAYLSEIFFLFASLIAAWFLCWRWTRIYFLLGSLLPAPIFLEPISFHRCSDFSFLLSIQASRPLGLPLGSPSGCVGLGQGCLFFSFSSSWSTPCRTASDLFTRCCCFHLPTAFSLILCLLISR